MNLESGVTVIAEPIGSRRDGEKIKVKIIYVSDTEGRINFPDGSISTISDQSYKKYLNAYKQKMAEEERAKQIDEIIPSSEGLLDEPEEEAELVFEDEDEFEEPEEEKPAEKTQLIPVKKQKPEKEKKKKINKPSSAQKKMKISLIILGVIVLLGIIVALLPVFFKGKPASSTPQQPTASVEATYEVATLKREITSGSLLTAEDLEKQTITESDYAALNRTIYVDGDGKRTEGTVVSWEQAASLVGAKALRTIPEGSVVMKEDFGSEDAQGQSTTQMRIVAIISSDQLDEDMMIELGRYVFTAGELQDILNTKGESILNEVLPAEGENKEEGK